MTTEIILQAVVTGLMMGLIYALIAAGLSLIFGLMDIVNFAHGDYRDVNWNAFMDIRSFSYFKNSE